MAPGVLERILAGLQTAQGASLEARVLAGRARNEDAAVLRVPEGKAIVQTVDFLTPIVDDAYSFGRIAAANALSDVYALGGEPWCAMNVVCFPAACAGAEGEAVLREILRGGLDALTEAGAVLVGGHTVEDEEIKYGLSVTGIIDPDRMAVNDGLKPGQSLILTKPLGTGILATAVKARWERWEHSEELLRRWCGALNAPGAAAIRAMGLTAATDITGFGLGGHALEMALASHAALELRTQALPLLDNVLDYARDGLIPAGSHANRDYWRPYARVAPSVTAEMESIVFDAQTSGGLLLAVPERREREALDMLRALGGQGWPVGRVLPEESGGVLVLV